MAWQICVLSAKTTLPPVSCQVPGPLGTFAPLTMTAMYSGLLGWVSSSNSQGLPTILSIIS